MSKAANSTLRSRPRKRWGSATRGSSGAPREQVGAVLQALASGVPTPSIMAVSLATAPRTLLWLEGLGDWAWPGSRPQPEPMPPAWLPSFPPRIALAPAGAAATTPAAGVRSRRQRSRPRRLLVTGALCALAAAGTVAGLDARPQLERL